jgi:hypothetical protein
MITKKYHIRAIAEIHYEGTAFVRQFYFQREYKSGINDGFYLKKEGIRHMIGNNLREEGVFAKHKDIEILAIQVL